MMDWTADITNDPFDDYNLIFELSYREDIVGTIKNTPEGLKLLWYSSKEDFEIPLDWIEEIIIQAKERLTVNK